MTFVKTMAVAAAVTVFEKAGASRQGTVVKLDA